MNDMKELWNAYDINFNLIENKILVRGEKIEDGMFHIVVHVLVKHIDGTYLLMQRSANKHFPLMFDASAAGSILLNETPIQGAIRELKEETGIVATTLEEIKREISLERHSLYICYLTTVDIAKDSITLQENETCNYVWIKPEELNDYKLSVDRVNEFII